MYPHRIRLRGPWEQDTPEGPRRVVLPGPFPGGPFTLRRRFGYPGRIDAHERVWLVIDGLKASAVALNGTPLANPSEADVTRLLAARNELAIEGPGGWVEAALEVRGAAYLRGLRFDAGGVSGEVVGEAPWPLDLYLLAGRGTACHGSITPTPEGRPFRLDGEGGGPFRVELVCGAVVWYAAAQTRDGREQA